MQAILRSRCLAVSSALLGALAATVWSVAGDDLVGDVEGYHFVIPTVTAESGGPVSIEIQGLHEESVQGFQLVVRYPSDELTLDRIHVEGTVLEAIESDFFEVTNDVAGGFFSVGLLVELDPPFEGQTIPNIGRPLTFLHLDGRVSEDVEDDLTLRLEDGLSSPPLRNVYVVDSQSIPVDEMAEGLIEVTEPLPIPVFVRGDANSDGLLDISDAVRILEYCFLGGARPECMNAADANDDEDLSISDSVFLLSYLFLGSTPPPPPLVTAGVDPTPGGLGCEHPVSWVGP